MLLAQVFDFPARPGDTGAEVSGADLRRPPFFALQVTQLLSHEVDSRHDLGNPLLGRFARLLTLPWASPISAILFD